MTERLSIRMTVNGEAIDAAVEPRRTLADFLREDLGLTGTHVGCEHGVCGACTVLLDGVTARSCILYAVQLDGAAVRTVEALAPDGELHPIMESMRECHGLQCGFCTPGFVMTIFEFLGEVTGPDEAADEGSAGREPVPMHRVRHDRRRGDARRRHLGANRRRIRLPIKE